jgi:aminoglycoside phosphotransferase (APT) family kinase protein
MQEYSKRLGHISAEQFQAALARFDLGHFIKAEPIPFGLFGQNVFLTSTKGEFVLRGVPHYPWQFPTERFFTNEFHAKTHVPVPYPYQLELSTDIFGWSFAIMPRMPGLQLQNKAVTSQLTTEDRIEIAHAVATILVEVQTLTWEHTGMYDIETGTVKPLEKHYREWIVDNIREKVDASRSYNIHTTASDAEWVECILAKAMPVLNLPYQPCTVLGDFGEHNLVVMHSGGGWTVSGLFDLMTAHFGDGQADLSSQVKTYLYENEQLADAFVGEYLRLKPMQPGFAAHQQLYMLDLATSHWRYWQKHHGSIPEADETLTLEQWAGPSVKYWSKFLT